MDGVNFTYGIITSNKPFGGKSHVAWEFTINEVREQINRLK